MSGCLKLETNKQNISYFSRIRDLCPLIHQTFRSLVWDTGSFATSPLPNSGLSPLSWEVSSHPWEYDLVVATSECEYWAELYVTLNLSKIYTFFKNYVKIFSQINSKILKDWDGSIIHAKEVHGLRDPRFKSHLSLSYNSLHLSFNMEELEVNSSIRILRTFGSSNTNKT